MYKAILACGRPSIRLLLIISILASLKIVAVEAHQQPTTKAAQSIAKGRVVYKDNLRPLKGVRLRVFKSDEPEAANVPHRPDRLVAVTNDRGEFQLSNLAAGKYYVTVEGQGVSAPSGFGMKLPLPISAIPRREDFEEIVPKHDAEFSVDGTNTVELEIAIVRGGVLSGKVQQPGRAPVPWVTINLISKESGAAGPYNARFTAQTDMHGEFRVENLPPGDYLVAASLEDKRGTVDMRSRIRRETQVVTYYPAATTIRDAQAVKVLSGHETSGVTVTLVPRRTFSVSGTLTRQQDGTPVGGVMVVLRNKEEQAEGSLAPGVGQRRTQTDAEGRWSFSNVLEGDYVVAALVPNAQTAATRMGGGPPDLQAADSEEAYRRSRQRFLVTQQELAVAGGNVSAVALTIAGPGSIRGTVTAANAGALPNDLVLFLELVREAVRPGPPLPVRVQPDGSFSMNGVQEGDVYLAVVAPPGSSYFVSSLNANGQDPRKSPLRVIEDAEVGPLEVVISPSLGNVSGRVLSEKGSQGLSNYVVLLLPVEPEKQRFRTSYLTTRTAADGSFSLAGPPGDYFALARRRDDFPPIITENFAKSVGQTAQRISLVANESKQLELRVP